MAYNFFVYVLALLIYFFYLRTYPETPVASLLLTANITISKCISFTHIL